VATGGGSGVADVTDSFRSCFIGENERMKLPVMPPVAPMLAKSVPDIPKGDLSFEPKWDGFRSIIFRDGDEVEIGSRNEKPMTRYFPEVVEAVKRSLPERCVVDGEIVVVVGDRLEFEVLQQRIHPAASRVRLLSEETPASFIATPTGPPSRSSSVAPPWNAPWSAHSHRST
jgi:ATP-dependent DNA ligase